MTIDLQGIPDSDTLELSTQRNQGNKMKLTDQIDAAITAQDIPTLKHLMKQMSEKQAKAQNTRLMSNAAKVFGWQR